MHPNRNREGAEAQQRTETRTLLERGCMPSMKKNALRHVVSAAISLVAVYAVVMSSGCSSGSDSTSTPPPPPPATKTIYKGTIYMASEMGGHIVAVPVSIDPSNATTPITLTTNPTRLVQLSNGTGTANKTHIFHDVRLDGTKLYYSSIFVDSTATADAGKVHLGYVDLANNNTKHDMLLDATTEAQNGMVYCGSGQTGTHYLPMTMSSPAYIDAIPKADMLSGTALGSADNVKRTLIESFRGTGNYLFAHGVNSPDHTKLFVAVNETDDTGMTGRVTGYLVKTSDLVAGTVDPTSVTTSYTITGLTAGMGTIAFRSTFTPDGSKILQAGRDRLLVLKSSDLTPLDNNMAIGGSYTGVENHDVMPTPDGKYAILSLRFKHAPTEQQDSGLQLYDLTNKTAIGNPVSTCSTCHSSTDTAHPTCGIDAALVTTTVAQ